VVSKTPLTSPLPTAIFPNRNQRNDFLVYLKNPPFILEKRQILMQGSLTVWVAEEMLKFR
jgi:hypothetical protein